MSVNTEGDNKKKHPRRLRQDALKNQIGNLHDLIAILVLVCAGLAVSTCFYYKEAEAMRKIIDFEDKLHAARKHEVSQCRVEVSQWEEKHRRQGEMGDDRARIREEKDKCLEELKTFKQVQEHLLAKLGPTAKLDATKGHHWIGESPEELKTTPDGSVYHDLHTKTKTAALIEKRLGPRGTSCPDGVDGMPRIKP